MGTDNGSAKPAGAPHGTNNPGLSRAVTRGSFWMMLSTVVQRGASFGAQIVLGWLLKDRDFGVYALAMSIYALCGSLRDGGIRQLLIQQHSDYERLVGPMFWMALTINTVIGLVLIAVAPPLAFVLDEPTLVGMMVILAVAQPLGTPAAILTVRLSIDLRFREAGQIAAVSSLFRYIGTIALAMLGFGPASFVLPLPALSLIEWAMAHAYTKEQPWRLSAAPRIWLKMLADARWIFVGAFGAAAINLGAALMIKPFVSTAVVGVYYFSYQVIVQVGMVLSGNIGQVLFPAFARIHDDPVRLSAAAVRALRQLMLIATPACLGLAAIFGPLELLIWHGKWASATDTVHATALLYPAVIASSVPLALQQACGRFRAWGLTLSMMGIASLAGSMAGAVVMGTAVGVALFASFATGFVSIAITWTTMRQIGVPPKDLIAALMPCWFTSCIAVLASFAFDELLAGRNTPPLMRAVASGATFIIVFAAMTRLAVPSHVREALAVMPSRMRGAASRLLRIGNV